MSDLLSYGNSLLSVFFFNDTATTEIYTLSLHDALPICPGVIRDVPPPRAVGVHDPDVHALRAGPLRGKGHALPVRRPDRSEEHTSELQSRQYLVCRLLLEKKKKDSRTELMKLQPNASRV